MTQRAKRNTSSTVCRLSRAVAVRNSPARAISLYQVYLGEFYRSVAVQERDPLGDSQPYSKGDFQIVVSHYDTATLRSDYPNVLQWAVDLTYNSIGKLYEQTWGWDSDRKLEELAHVRSLTLLCTLRNYTLLPRVIGAPCAFGARHDACPRLRFVLQSDSRHLLAQQYTSGSRIPVTVAYMCYRWEHDPLEEECRDDEQPVPVAYVYELQVDPCAQGKGIGPHLMHVLERMVRPFFSIDPRIHGAPPECVEYNSI